MRDLQTYVYTASSYKESLKIARDRHGENALIVSAEKVNRKSYADYDLWEVVVIAPDEDNNNLYDVEKLKSIAKKTIQKKQEAIKEKSKNIESNIETKYNFDELKTIKDELYKINNKINNIQSMFWSDVNSKKQSVNIPYEFAEIYKICKNSSMKNEHLEEIMQFVSSLMPLKFRENGITIKKYFREILKKMIPYRVETHNNKKIMMFVGPTGVGKTTTLAKLATHYSLKYQQKVGLITLDSYKIGAYDQLAFYAKKLKLSISAINDTTEFAKSLDDLSYCDYILIDTIGSSQHDKQKLDILKQYTNQDYDIDVNLVLCATTKYEDLLDIYNSFRILNINSLIFSKLDESSGFGNIFSLIYETKIPVSYFTIGQEVPEDILVASNDYLLDCMIDGFPKAKRKE